MTPTREQIEQIPEVYREFLLVLKPIPDSRGAVLEINGIPLGKVFNALAPKYGYTPSHVRALAVELQKNGLINPVDALGFVTPTPKGEDLIAAIAGAREPEPITIPHFQSRKRGLVSQGPSTLIQR
ncbi:MAG: hypothetical protein ABI353_21965 [Isosphaeraceae bacterium]